MPACSRSVSCSVTAALQVRRTPVSSRPNGSRSSSGSSSPPRIPTGSSATLVRPRGRHRRDRGRSVGQRGRQQRAARVDGGDAGCCRHRSREGPGVVVEVDNAEDGATGGPPVPYRACSTSTCSRSSTACGRPAPRRSSINGQRVTATDRDPFGQRRHPRQLPSTDPPYEVQRRSVTPGRSAAASSRVPAASGCSTPPTPPASSSTSAMSNRLTLPAATAALRLAEPEEPRDTGARTAARHPRRAAASMSTCPLALQPYLPIAVVAALDAVFGGLRAVMDGVFNDKVFVVSFVANVHHRRVHRVPRRPARRGLTAVDGGDRRPRHPHLHQRRDDSTARLPCLSPPAPRVGRPRRPPDREAAPASGANAGSSRPSPTGLNRLDARQCGRDRTSARWASPSWSGCSGSRPSCRYGADDEDLLNRARRADLFQILDGLTARGDQLERTGRRAGGRPARAAHPAPTASRPRWSRRPTLARQLAVLAGTVRRTGPGIT